mmetsp:Transcript_13076/g.30375  ORF Transcript_13076/g.30375 Transcript_13076/m.30375 type:complete len:360 (-) Transcript_13076:182-1261(-)
MLGGETRKEWRQRVAKEWSVLQSVRENAEQRFGGEGRRTDGQEDWIRQAGGVTPHMTPCRAAERSQEQGGGQPPPFSPEITTAGPDHIKGAARSQLETSAAASAAVTLASRHTPSLSASSPPRGLASWEAQDDFRGVDVIVQRARHTLDAASKDHWHLTHQLETVDETIRRTNIRLAGILLEPHSVPSPPLPSPAPPAARAGWHAPQRTLSPLGSAAADGGVGPNARRGHFRTEASPAGSSGAVSSPPAAFSISQPICTTPPCAKHSRARTPHTSSISSSYLQSPSRRATSRSPIKASAVSTRDLVKPSGLTRGGAGVENLWEAFHVTIQSLERTIDLQARHLLRTKKWVERMAGEAAN